MTPLRKSDELIGQSECLRQALDEHVDALAEAVSDLRKTLDGLPCAERRINDHPVAPSWRNRR